MAASKQHTTSIVDISELEDDEVPLNGPGEPAGAGGGAGSGQPGARQPAAHLYLYHENTHPNQRIPNLLSVIGGGGAQSAAAPPADGGSRDPSPAQTLSRLPAIDYHYPAASASPVSPAGLESGASRSATPGGLGPGAPDVGPGQAAKLGILSGVYFPCLQNIFGVILFIRMVWIVGTAGIPAAFALVFVCCSVTLTTSISLSAIATNGIVPAGGSYFMISRSLGPECGGAVGTMFFLGTTFAGAMYITGAVEIILNYLAPSWGLFGDFQRDVSIMYHNIRFYGSILLVLVGILVWIGVRFVSKLAPIALFCVLFSIAGVYMGIFINYNGRDDLMVCVVGDRLVTLKSLPYEEPPLPAALAGQQQLDNSYNLNWPGASGQPTSGGGGARPNASRNSLSALDQAAQYQLRRTRHLCTYEKLRYVFCPNTDDHSQQQQQQTPPAGQYDAFDAQQQQQRQPEAALDRQANPYQDLFKRPANMSNCDTYFKANKDRIHLEKAVPGIASGIYQQNLKPRFREKRNLVSYDEGVNTNESNDYIYVFVDITTSFTILISIYFPSCTGILAGSNRSGDLADAQKSIPKGTLAAQLTTSFVYLSCVVLFGCTFNNLFIRDKFGENTAGQLAITQVAWPHPLVILMGGLFSTLGAALQSLVGAPRVLQGIARDEVIPCFNRFAKLSARGEPETAILFTLTISWFAVLIGNLDFIAPILTLSLVMCYFFINLACTLHSLLGSPNWRPRFRHYHWTISSLGCLLCLFVMIVSSWVNFLIAIFLAGCIYKYIEFSGAEKEWGDGKQGLALSAARYNLLRLKTSEPHAKNWRPQVLLFCKLKPAPPEALAGSEHAEPAAKEPQRLALACPTPADGAALLASSDNEQLCLAQPKLLTFASQLKAGKGLTLVSSIIEGDFKEFGPLAQRARNLLQDRMQEERVKGFADVLVASNIMDGLSYQIQTAGLGGLKHNTVIVGWPRRWRRPLAPPAAGRPTPGEQPAATSGARKASLKQQQQPPRGPKPGASRAHLFIELLRSAQVSQNSLLVVKGVESWPESCDRLGGYIDIWWIVNDGGLLMLLPHLLKQHRTWKCCRLRIFTVAQPGDNIGQMRADLSKFLYHLRIEAQVDIVEMNNNEVSDYAYERTLMMEQRSEIMKRLNVNRKQSLLLEQEVDGRVIRFRIRKPSLCDFEESTPSGSSTGGSSEHYPMVEMASLPESAPTNSIPASPSGQQQQQQQQAQQQQQQQQQQSSELNNIRPDEINVQRMHTALTLNEAILKRSKSAKLVIINLPGAPKISDSKEENNYMEFIEIITDKLERVLLVQSGGREVITIHS